MPSENSIGVEINRQRVHSGLSGRLPEPGEARVPLNFASYRWQQHCRGLMRHPSPHDFGNFAKDTSPKEVSTFSFR
jgi:hypothetical protein